MNFTFVIRPEAKADIDSAFDWYQSKREGLGFEFERCLEAAFSRLLHDPESFAFEFDELRRVPVRRFPFGIFYLVDAQEVVVIAVYHSHRDMRTLKSRIS